MQAHGRGSCTVTLLTAALPNAQAQDAGKILKAMTDYKVMIKIDQPQLSPADIKKFQAAMHEKTATAQHQKL